MTDAHARALAALSSPDLEQRCVNAIRVLAMDGVQKANSGHPGLPMGAADLAWVLWSRFLHVDPTTPQWPNRDRFVLSAGHGSMLLYALLHLTGFDLTLEDLRQFRQWGSRTPGHPEHGETPGVEITTGPLGQGISSAVGMAMAERHLAARLAVEGAFAPIDHFTTVLASDGDMMEGVQSEAASLAGHLGLGKLVVLYDDNRITIDGETSLAFSEDVARRYEAYGWHVQSIDGHDRDAIGAAIEAARADHERPSLIRARTHIALGSPHKQDSEEAHGSPLGQEEVDATKKVYGWPLEPKFFVPDEVHSRFAEIGSRGRAAREAWERDFAAWRQTHPEKGMLWDALMHPAVPATDDGRPTYEPGSMVSTRSASGKALNWLSPRVPALWGGSADLAPSNKTLIAKEAAFSKETPEGRNLHFGIREHAMAAIMNGMALHGGVLPYGATFLVFSDYLRPSLRLAALMKLPAVYVFTHDSIFLGEDGPTHQPEAHLAALRAIPGCTVIRPCDAEETTRAWECAFARRGPTALILTRQDLPVLDHAALGISEDLTRGAYVALDPGRTPELLCFATGSEVWVCIEAARRVNADGGAVRVIAVPSWEMFAEQPAEYRARILSGDISNRMAVEAAGPLGWERFVGTAGEIVALEGYGASAPAEVLAEKFGFTVEAVETVMRRRTS